MHPGAIEVKANRIDEDCDGWLADADDDGFNAPADCDDSEPNAHPGAPEYPRNVIDENCDGRLADADGDGFDAPGRLRRLRAERAPGRAGVSAQRDR